jgi:pimeloyl-ACP methyl ester carboxylesterase
MNWLLLVFSLLLFAGLSASLISYAFFWYETANGPHLARLKGRYGQRLPRLLMVGILSSFLSSLLTMVSFPLGILPKRPGRNEAESTGPRLILIHGLYHNDSAWILLQRRLRRAGFSNMTTLSYSSFRHAFWELSEEINQHIVESTDSESGPVVLIGHSLGGLLASAFARYPAGRGKVAGLITLGSPHRGSKLAVLGWGPLARDLVFEGSIVRELEQRPPTGDFPRIALRSPMDNMVLPNDALDPAEPGWTVTETDPVSHVAMLYHRRTAEQVVEAVRRICRPI